MRIRVYGSTAIVLAIVGALFLAGCAAQQKTKQPSPEELAQMQDSIAKANERDLKIARMFAYDKLKQSQWEEARRYLWKVVNLDVKHQYNDWSRLYQSYMNTNQPDSAQYVLGVGLKYHPDDPFLCSTLGFMLKTQGNMDSALVLYKTASAIDTGNVDFLKKIAEIYEVKEMPDEAIAAYEQLQKLSPDDQSVKDKLSYLLRKFRAPEDYIKHLEEEVAGKPDDLEKRMELLFAYSDQNLNDKVVSQANEVLKRDATRREAYRRKAQAYENLGKSKEAIDAYSALLKRDPSDNEARLQIADNFRQLEDWVKARTWILDAKKAAGGTLAEADFLLGQVYEASSDAASKGRGIEYDDKLVLAIAYGLFKKAANSEDYAVQDKANRRIQFFEQNKFIPQYSDWFMAQDKSMPARSDYSWIQTGWPEVSFLQKYLSDLAKSK
ncbi:MAG: tetratricopeptide repeat protein [bacterium]